MSIMRPETEVNLRRQVYATVTNISQGASHFKLFWIYLLFLLSSFSNLIKSDVSIRCQVQYKHSSFFFEGPQRYNLWERTCMYIFIIERWDCFSLCCQAVRLSIFPYTGLVNIVSCFAWILSICKNIYFLDYFLLLLMRIIMSVAPLPDGRWLMIQWQILCFEEFFSEEWILSLIKFNAEKYWELLVAGFLVAKGAFLMKCSVYSII